MAHELTLGGPLLRADDAPALPDHWLDALLGALGSADGTALSRTCTPALNWLLADWPSATLTLFIKEQEGQAALASRLAAVQSALVRRGAKPTAFVLRQQGDVPADDPRWPVFLAILSSPAAVSVTMQLQQLPGRVLPDTLVFHALQRLTLSQPSTDQPGTLELPPPTTIPNLCHLIIHTISVACAAGLWASVAPYLPQLVSLTLGKRLRDAHIVADRPLWAAAFQPAYRSERLTSVTLPCLLEPWLVALLQQCAPALQEVSLTGGYQQPEGTEEEPPLEPCTWQVLRIKEHCVTLNNWWLPPPEDPPAAASAAAERRRMTVELEDAYVSLILPMNELALIAMERFTLKGHTRVDVQAWGGADMQAESLSEALPLLQASAYTAGTRLTLTDMTISPALTEVLTAAAAAGWRLDVSCDQWLAGPADAPPPPLPALAALRLQMPLTDNTLACIVLSAAAGIEHLHVPKAKLDRLRQIPTSIALPWQALTVGDVELCVPVTYNVQESIERSPEYHIGTLHLSLAREQVESGDIQAMTDSLRRHPITSITSVKIAPPQDLPAADQPKWLNAALRVAQALPCVPRSHIYVAGWAATEENIRELRDLPNLPCKTHIWLQKDASVPAPHEPRTFPDLVGDVVIYTAGLTPSEVDSIMVGALAGRVPNAPVTVVLNKVDQGLLGDLQAKVAITDPHVKLLSDRDQWDALIASLGSDDE